MTDTLPIEVSEESGSPDPSGPTPGARPGLSAILAGLRPKKITMGEPVLPLIVLFAIAMIDEMDRTAQGVLAPEIRDYFGLDFTRVNVLLSVGVFFTLILALPAGFLSDRVNRTKLTAIGAGLLGLFGIATGFAPTLLLFAIARTGSGLGRTLDPTHNSLLADYYPQKARAGVYGYRQIGVEMGRLIGPLVAGLVASWFIWQASFFLFAIPAIIFAALAWRLGEPVRGIQERRAMGVEESDAADEQRAPSIGEALRITWSVRTLRRILWALPFLVGSVLSLTSLIAFYYEDVFHVGSGMRGFLIAMGEPFAIAGLLVGSSVSNRLLAERPGRVIVYAGVMSVGAGFIIAGLAVAPFLPVAVVLAWGGMFALSIIAPAASALISLVVPPPGPGPGSRARCHLHHPRRDLLHHGRGAGRPLRHTRWDLPPRSHPHDRRGDHRVRGGHRRS